MCDGLDAQDHLLFGKYKGQPLTTFLSDVKYLSWMATTDIPQKRPVFWARVLSVQQTLLAHDPQGAPKSTTPPLSPTSVISKRPKTSVLSAQRFRPQKKLKTESSVLQHFSPPPQEQKKLQVVQNLLQNYQTSLQAWTLSVPNDLSQQKYQALLDYTTHMVDTLQTVCTHPE